MDDEHTPHSLITDQRQRDDDPTPDSWQFPVRFRGYRNRKHSISQRFFGSKQIMGK